MKTTRKASSGLTGLSLLLPCLLLGPSASCTSNRPTATALQRLQGTWEGFAMGRDTPTGPYVRSKPASKITITITGNALHFYRDADFQWESTFTLPVGKTPQHLHATIQRPEDSSGEGVISFFEIEDGTLTLGGIRDEESTAEWPKNLEEAKDTMTGRYQLRRVAPR